MHGQSEYTPTKQRHLMGLLTMCSHGWNPQINDKPRWAHDEVICIDCTSGNGHAETGDIGSPLIINQWALKEYGHDFRQLCCERVPSSYVHLTENTMAQADMVLGPYQDIARDWLRSLELTKPALGFVYCDPNGAKDLLEGIDFFRWVVSDPKLSRLDFIFHWSLTAYERNFGANVTWANDSLVDIIQELRSLKQVAIMREPVDKHRWVIMYLFNSTKIDAKWRKEGFIPADEWMDKYLRAKGQRPLFDEQVLAEMVK